MALAGAAPNPDARDEGGLAPKPGAVGAGAPKGLGFPLGLNGDEIAGFAGAGGNAGAAGAKAGCGAGAKGEPDAGCWSWVVGGGANGDEVGKDDGAAANALPVCTGAKAEFDWPNAPPRGLLLPSGLLLPKALLGAANGDSTFVPNADGAACWKLANADGAGLPNALGVGAATPAAPAPKADGFPANAEKPPPLLLPLPTAEPNELGAELANEAKPPPPAGFAALIDAAGVTGWPNADFPKADCCPKADCPKAGCPNDDFPKTDVDWGALLNAEPPPLNVDVAGVLDPDESTFEGCCLTAMLYTCTT